MATKSAIRDTHVYLIYVEADKIAKLIPGWCLKMEFARFFEWRWSL
jgi:hypothetical protein